MHQIHIFEQEQPLEKRILECGDSLMLGRSRDCDIHFNQPDVSRYHARVDHRFNELVLVIESRSGATLNGKTVFDEIKLSDGDTLELGGAVKIKVAKYMAEEGAPLQSLEMTDSEVNETATIIHSLPRKRHALVALDSMDPAELADATGTVRVIHEPVDWNATANGRTRAKGRFLPTIRDPHRMNAMSRLGLPIRNDKHKHESVHALQGEGSFTPNNPGQITELPALQINEVDSGEKEIRCETELPSQDKGIHPDKASMIDHPAHSTGQNETLPLDREEEEEEEEEGTGLFEVEDDDDLGMTGFWEPPMETLLFEPLPDEETGVNSVEDDAGQTIMMNPMELEEEERKVILRAERKKTMRTMGKLFLCVLPVLLLILYVSRDTIILDQRVDWPKKGRTHLVEFETVQAGLEVIYPKITEVNLEKTKDELTINSTLPSGVELFHVYRKEKQKRFLTMTNDEAFRGWMERSERLYGVRPDMQLVREHFLTNIDGGAGVPYRHFPHTADGGRVGWTMYFRNADEIHSLRLEVAERDAFRAEGLLEDYNCLQISEDFERHHWVPTGGDFSGDPESVLADISRDLKIGGTGRWPQIQLDLIGILVQAKISEDSAIYRKGFSVLMALGEAQRGWYLNARHQMKVDREDDNREYWMAEIQRLFGGGRDNRGIELN